MPCGACCMTKRDQGDERRYQRPRLAPHRPARYTLTMIAAPRLDEPCRQRHAFARRKPASGGLRPASRHSLSRWPSQPTDAPRKTRLRYDGAWRGAPVRQKNQSQCPAIPAPGPGKKELDKSIEKSRRSFAGRSRFGSAFDFGNSVRPGGEYDWKLRIRGSASFGNFAYGATGRAQGYTLGKLQGMATIVQAFDDIRHLDFDGFGDNPGDAGEIAAGAAYYDRGCYL